MTGGWRSLEGQGRLNPPPQFQAKVSIFEPLNLNIFQGTSPDRHRSSLFSCCATPQLNFCSDVTDCETKIQTPGYDWRTGAPIDLKFAQKIQVALKRLNKFILKFSVRRLDKMIITKGITELTFKLLSLKAKFKPSCFRDTVLLPWKRAMWR